MHYIEQEQREEDAYFALDALGMTLMKSGYKPGTIEPAYRILFKPRMTIAEVEAMIETQRFVSDMDEHDMIPRRFITERLTKEA